MPRIKSRLSEWKSRNLSFDGRLIILKYVLSSLHVYVFPSSKLPRVSSFLLNLFYFFLGGCEDHRKIGWIGWESICKNKEFGGFGVRQIKDFNSSARQMVLVVFS